MLFLPCRVLLFGCSGAWAPPLLLGLVNIAVQGVLGDAEELAHLVAGFGNQEGSRLVEEPDGLHLVLLAHEGHRLAHQLDALGNELIQKVGHTAGDGLGLLRLLLGGGELLEAFLHGQHEGDVVVDAKHPDGLPGVVPEVEGGGLEDFSVLGAGQVAQVVLHLPRPGPKALQHRVGGAVPHLPPGDVAVFNGHDGAVRVVGAQIVYHHLAVGPELPGQTLGQVK